MGFLEAVEEDDRVNSPFRLPVQCVNRPDLDLRGFAGTITGGTVRVGGPVMVLPCGARSSSVARIVTFDGDREQAVAEESVTITLATRSTAVVATCTARSTGPGRSLTGSAPTSSGWAKAT